jgi:hypothetical protein
MSIIKKRKQNVRAGGSRLLFFGQWSEPLWQF